MSDIFVVALRHTHDKSHRAFWLNVHEFCHSSVRSCPADPIDAIITTQRVEELSKKLIDAANCPKKQSENSVPPGPYERQFPKYSEWERPDPV